MSLVPNYKPVNGELRNRQLTRTLKLLFILIGGRTWTFNELAVELGVHHKTIRRDVEALEMAGIPVTSDDGCPIRVGVMKGWGRKYL